MPVEQSNSHADEIVYDDFYGAGWDDVVETLGVEPGSVGILALDRGRVDDTLLRRGDFVKGQFEEFDFEGMVLNGDILEGPEVIPRERCEAGYYLSNSMGSNIELKFVEDAPEVPGHLGPYPEDLHWHNADEHYISDGQFDMVIANGNFPTQYDDYKDEIAAYNSSAEFVMDNPEYFDQVTLSEDAPVLKVNSGVPHAIMSMEEGSSLGILRVPDGDEYIGKWDWRGDQVYDHLAEEPGFPGIATYSASD